jgi:hypothetical protein
VVFLGDAHRESGVISLCFALSPVESCSPPELVELTPHIYSSVLPNASEQFEEGEAGTSPTQIVDKLKSLAGAIYGIYQYCTTLNSAFACWGIAAAM